MQCANSYRWCAPFLVYEPLTPDQKDKPKDSLANWIKCAEQVRNLNALKATTALRNGARHCVVPTRVLPDEGQPLKIIQGQDSDAGALEKILKGERRGTPAAEEEAEGKSKSECDSFAEIHTSVLEPPREIIHITTKVALLQQEDLDKLKASCLEFKLAFNASYPGSYPVKAHVVSDHLWRQARKWGTNGWMAEQGVEAYHPRYEDAKITARNIKNPKARMKAQLQIVKVKQ